MIAIPSGGRPGAPNVGRSVLAYVLAIAFGLFAIFLLFPQTAYADPTVDDKARWVDKNTIRLGDANFKLSSSSTSESRWIFAFSTSNPTCRSTLAFHVNPYGNNGGQSAYRKLSVNQGGMCFTAPEDQGKRDGTLIGVANASAVNANGNDGANGELVDSERQEAEETCESELQSRMSWAICPISDAIRDFFGIVDSWINQLLTVNTSMIFGGPSANDEEGKSSAAFYSAWNSFRALALGLVVIAALVIIIASAFGVEFLDAYTMRKALPRVLIAVLFISLSWQVMEFLVTLSNDVGNGIRALMYAPFDQAFDQAQLRTGSMIMTMLAVGGALYIMTAPGLLFFALAAFLALLTAFLVLILRELIIMVLVILAPVAIAAMILPNTQRLWQTWQKTLTTVLIMFPIIAAMIAAGRIFSVVTYNNGEAGGIMEIIAFAAYILPYFMLPFAFKMAGGVMAFMGGIASNASRPITGGLRKMGMNQTRKNLQDIKSGNRLKGDNWASDKINRIGAGAAAMPAAGFNPRRAKSRMKAALSRQTMDEAAKFGEENSAMRDIIGNDDFLYAGIEGGGNDNKVREYLRAKVDDDGNRIYSDDTVEQATAQIREARRGASSEVFETAAAMALPSTGTAFKNGAGEMHDYINKVAGGDRMRAARMLAGMRQGAAQARRFDLGGGSYGQQLGVLEAQYKGEKTSAEADEIITEASLEGQGGSYIAGARTGAVKNFAPAMRKKLKKVADTGNMQEFQRELATIAGRYDAMSGSSPDNARVLANEVLSKDVNGGTSGKTIQELIEEHRTDPNFLEMRREYGAAASRGAQQAAQQLTPAQMAALAQQQQQGGPQGPVQPPPMPPPQKGPFG